VPRNEFTGFGDFAEDLREFASDTADARSRVDTATDRALERIADAAFRQSQRDVAVDTGELKRSGEVYRRADGVYVIRYTADHALAIEEGADPHIIEPRDADALRFETKSGEVVYTMLVRHPGNEAQPFLGPAIDAQRDELPAALAEELETELRRAYR
jgi:hypothetical protein